MSIRRGSRVSSLCDTLDVQGVTKRRKCPILHLYSILCPCDTCYVHVSYCLKEHCVTVPRAIPMPSLVYRQACDAAQ